MRSVVTAVIVVLLLASRVHGHEGWGVVVHERLGVLVADIPGNTIWRMAGGRSEPLLRGIHSHDLAVGADNAIYGSNPEPGGNLSSVWRIDPNGRFSYVLEPEHRSDLGLQSFAMTRDHCIYTANRYDHQRPTIVLLRREPTGEITPVAGGAIGFRDGPAGAARFAGIDGMREAPDGTLVLADGAYLRKVSRDGLVSTVAGPLTSRRWGEDLLGISSIHGEIVHVADHAGRRVLRVNLRNGQVQEAMRSAMFWAPAGVEHRQFLYVLEHLRPPLSLFGDLQIGPYLRVRRVAPNGTAVTLFVVWGRRSGEAAAVATALLAGIFVALRTIRRKRVPAV